MKKIKRILLCSILSLGAIASGCATVYEKEGVFTNGYSDFQKTPDLFVVTFRANEHTASEKVLEYALRRSAEIAQEHGFRYFTVLEQLQTGKHLNYPSMRLTIQCYHEPPAAMEWIDAEAVGHLPH